MRKLLLILLMLSGAAATAQNFPPIYGKIRYVDSLQFAKYRNNVAGDSVLSTDTSGKLRMKKIVNGAAVDTIYRIAGIDSIYYIIGGVTKALLDSTGAGGGGSTDTTSLSNRINLKAPQYPTRDIYYINQETFPGVVIPAGYTAVGSPTYTVTGGKVAFTGAGGAGGITKYIRSDLGVLDECNTVSITEHWAGAPGAATFGAYVGLQSYNGTCGTASVIAGYISATGDANFGKAFIYSPYSATYLYSDANTDINASDVVNISLTQVGWKYTVIVRNYTQDWELRRDVVITNTFTPILANNSAYPAFYHAGGSVSVDSFKYTIHAPANTDIMFLGNSITFGQEASLEQTRFVNTIGEFENNVASGGGCDITQSIVTRLPHILAIKPARVILYDLAGNDIQQGILAATWQANLATIRNTLVNAGIKVIWANGSPRTAVDETAQKTFIEGEPMFKEDLKVDTWTPLVVSGFQLNPIYSSDGVHLNDAGMQVVSDAFNTALGFKFDNNIVAGTLTPGRAPYVTTGGLLTDNQSYQYDQPLNTLVLTNPLFYGIVGFGSSATPFTSFGALRTGGGGYMGTAIRGTGVADNTLQKLNNFFDSATFIINRYDRGFSVHTGITGNIGDYVADDVNTRLVVNNSGNVGIGTSFASINNRTRLQVTGKAAISDTLFNPGNKYNNTSTSLTMAVYDTATGAYFHQPIPSGGSGISGLTTNELVYGSSATTIASLPVATYPSLAELAYVKGLTSAVQTQIDTKISASSTNVLTNKRWTARVGSTASSGTPTINTDNVDIFKITAQAAAITSFTTNLSGTPVDGDILEIQITDDGTARAITWGASFVSSSVSLPATTTISTTLTVIVQYFTTSSYGNNKWVCVNYF